MSKKITEFEKELSRVFTDDEINGRVFQAETEEDFDNYCENRFGSCEYDGKFFTKAYIDEDRTDLVLFEANENGGWDQQ